MKGGWTVPVIFSILFIGTLGFTPNVYAPQGEIVWLNPALKAGMIAEDGCDDKSCQYPFQIPSDLADSNYIPQVGHIVTFDVGPGNTASNIAPVPTCPPGTTGTPPFCS